MYWELKLERPRLGVDVEKGKVAGAFGSGSEDENVESIFFL